MASRRSFVHKAILSLAASFPFLGRAKSPQKPVKGKFIHMVFFWLKDDSNPAVDAFIEKTEEFLRQVNSIGSYHLGRPAATDRPIIDRSYTVCLVVVFDNKEAHDQYQAHPVHVKYAGEIGDQYSKIQIYDSVAS